MRREKENEQRLGKKMKGHGLLCSFVLFAGFGQGETKLANKEEENGEGAASHVPSTPHLNEMGERAGQ